MVTKALPPFTDEEVAHAQLIVEIVGPIIDGLARALGPRTEVILHDLTKIPKSIAVISGTITGRAVGGPPTDLGLKTFLSGRSEDLIGYRTEFDNGLIMRSSSLFFSAPSGRTVAALCINSDINDLLKIQDFVSAMTNTTTGLGEGSAGTVSETFPSSVEMLAQGILRDAISATGVKVELMKKNHKLDVVKELNDRGFFTLREAVDLAAKSLAVSRYSIYNYLNELGEDDSPEPA